MAKIIFQDIKLNRTSRPLFVPKKEDKLSDSLEENEKIKTTKIENKLFNDFEIKQEIEKAKTEEAKKIKLEKEKNNHAPSYQRLTSTPQIKKDRKIINRFILTFFVISVILGGIYWGSSYFQKANITITSKHQVIDYKNKQFIASKDKSIGAVDFEIMITSDEKLKNYILTEPKEVSVKAKGSIYLFNEFSTTPQKLLAGTFLADQDGKTYKTDSTVTIPGYKLDENKKIIPGKILVNISAFLPGESYNGNPENFYVTSFKGTAKFKKIYGKLNKTLEGGISGFVYTMNDTDKSKIENIAQTSFRDDLFKKVNALVPPGYILYPNAMTFSYEIVGDVISKTPEAEIKINGSLSVVLLNESSLVNNIIKISLPEVKGGELKELKILDLNKLSFNFINKDQTIIKDMNSIPFFLDGSVDAIWSPDIEILKTKLKGINKNEVLPIFRQDPGISSAIVKIFPPWKKYIPDDLSKINIILK